MRTHPQRTKVENVLARHDNAQDAKRPLEADFRDIAKFVLPRAMTSFGMGREARRGVVSDVAKDACENTASGIDGLLFGGTDHYTVKMRDKHLNERDDVSAYTAHMAETLNAALRTPRSGFESARQKAMQSAVAFGALCVFSEDNPSGMHLSFRAVPIAKTYFLESDGQGRPSGVQVLTRMAAREAVAKFKSIANSTLPQKIVDAASDEKRAGTMFEFLHEVRPRDVYAQGKRDALNLPFASTYVSLDGQPQVVSEGGYHEQPYHTARLMGLEDSPWGWSFGLTALSTIKRLNNVVRTDLKAGHRIVEPSHYVVSGAFKGRIDRRPDKLTYTKPDKAGNAPEIRKWPGPDGLAFGMQIEEKLEAQVHKAFYSDLLDIPLSPNMTATEYLGRVQQMMRRMGSPVGNIENEFALPVGRRSFNMLWRARQFDFEAMPQVLQGLGPGDYIVEFISPLERSRQAGIAESILRTIEGAGVIEQIAPGSRDNLDGDRALRLMAEANKAPEGLVRDQNDVQTMRQQRQAAQEQQQQADMAERAVGGVKTLADAAGRLEGAKP